MAVKSDFIKRFGALFVLFMLLGSVAGAVIYNSYREFLIEHAEWEETFDDIVTLNYTLTDGLDVFDTLNITGGQAFLDTTTPTIAITATATDNFGAPRMIVPNGIEAGDFLLLYVNSWGSGGTPSGCTQGSVLFSHPNYDNNGAITTEGSLMCQIFSATGNEDGTWWGVSSGGPTAALAFYAIRNHGMSSIADIHIEGTLSSTGIDSDSPDATPALGSQEYLWISTSAVFEATSVIGGAEQLDFVSYPTNYNLGQINRDFTQSSPPEIVGIAMSGRLLEASSENPGAYDWDCDQGGNCDRDSNEGWVGDTIAIPHGFETSGALRFTIPTNTHVQDITTEFDDTTTDASNTLRNRLLNSVPSTIYTGPIIDTETSPVTHANINITNAVFLQVGFVGDGGSGPFLNNSTVVYAIIIGPEPIWDSPADAWIAMIVFIMIIAWPIFLIFGKRPKKKKPKKMKIINIRIIPFKRRKRKGRKR